MDSRFPRAERIHLTAGSLVLPYGRSPAARQRAPPFPAGCPCDSCGVGPSRPARRAETAPFMRRTIRLSHRVVTPRRRPAAKHTWRSHLIRWVGTSSDAFDEHVDGWFEGHRGHPRGQQALYAASLLAESVLLLTGGATALVDSSRTEVTRHRVASVALVAALTALTKRTVRRRRPFQPGKRPLRVSPDTSSFPSGHTLWAVLAAAWLAEDRWPGWVAYPTAGFVGLSRVHLRLHRASDVAAAAVIGCGAWVVVRRVDARRRRSIGRFGPLAGAKNPSAGSRSQQS